MKDCHDTRENKTTEEACQKTEPEVTGNADPTDQSGGPEADRCHYFAAMVYHADGHLRGKISLESADGFYACEGNEITGLITFRFLGKEMEILSLDSLHENRGTGTALLDAAVREAEKAGSARIRLTTTNDNLPALRFYQKRGFDMVRLYRNAVDQARKIKPEIPLTGMDGIPLKHEIELERRINDSDSLEGSS